MTETNSRASAPTVDVPRRAWQALVVLLLQSQDRLVGYVVPGAAEQATVLEHCRSELPGYMVPSQFVMLEGWPLNANGKVDRRQLPAPEVMAMGASEYVAARTAAEQQVVDAVDCLRSARHVLPLEASCGHRSFLEEDPAELLRPLRRDVFGFFHLPQIVVELVNR